MAKAIFALLVWSAVACISAASEPAAVWSALAQPAFDPAKYGSIANATLERDRIRITLAEGTIHFSQAVEGQVFGAAFRGRGRLQITPPNPLEVQQLRLFTGQDSLDMEFSEAAFVLGDGAADELAAKAKWSDSPDPALAALYRDRQQDREDVGAEVLPRLFRSVMSQDRKRSAFFAADLKTNAKGWMHVAYDALAPEEVTVGRWARWERTRNFDNWMSFPAGDRAAAEAWRDPLAKNDFHVVSYRIDATVTNSAELRATTQVKIEHRSAGPRALLFHLDANLRVESVKDAGGAALPFFQPRDPKDREQSYGDYVAVVLPEPARAGEARTLEFRYGGKRVIRKVGAGAYFCQSYGWYPTLRDSFAARADFEMNFRSPKRYTLVATGAKANETVDGDEKFSTWKSEIPLAVVGFAFGDFRFGTEKAGTIDVDVYANKEPDDFMRSILVTAEPAMGETGGRLPVGSLSPAALTKTMGAELANTVRLFEAYFGPYPYKRLAVTNIPYSYGQGWPGLIYLSALSFLDSTQRNALGIRDHVQISDFFRAHESSHQWWGHRVGWKSYHDQWLSEGFAQFSGNLYVRYRRNEKEFLTRLRKDKEELLSRDEKNRIYESLGPVWMGQRLSSSDAPRAYANVVYNKGGLVLHMLRMMLTEGRAQQPDERFMAMMKDFCQTYHNQPASTEDFKAMVEKHMTPAMDAEGNRRMDWFFRQYVYGTGVPRYQFRYTLTDAGDGKWKVAGVVTQSGVPAGWMDVLPVYVHTQGRVIRAGALRVGKAESAFDFTLPVKPEKISLNDNEDTLAEIRQ